MWRDPGRERRRSGVNGPDRPGRSELGVIVALLALIVLSVTLGSGRGVDLELFFGRFHPALVHLPIGVLLLAALLEGVLRASRFGAGGHAVASVLLVGAWSAILAAVTGLYLAQGGGYVCQHVDMAPAAGHRHRRCRRGGICAEEARPTAGHTATGLRARSGTGLHRGRRRRPSRRRADARRGLP